MMSDSPDIQKYCLPLLPKNQINNDDVSIDLPDRKTELSRSLDCKDREHYCPVLL